MPIIQETGGAAGAGIAAGLQQATQRLLQEEQRKELMQFESDLQLEKEKSRIAFAHELDLQKDVIAQQWELTKAQKISEINFAMQEKNRMARMDRHSAEADRLQKHMEEFGIGPGHADYDALRTKLAWHRSIANTGEEEPVGIATFQERPKTKEQMMFDLLSGRAPAAKQVTAITPEMQTEARTENKVFIRDKLTGEVQKLSATDAQSKIGLSKGQWELAEVQAAPAAPPVPREVGEAPEAAKTLDKLIELMAVPPIIKGLTASPEERKEFREFIKKIGTKLGQPKPVGSEMGFYF